MCSQADVSRVFDLISRYGLPVEIPLYDRQQLLNSVAADKKSKGDSITFICNRGIGMYAMSHHTPEELLMLSGLEA